MVLPPETAVAMEQWGLLFLCACLLMLVVGKLRLGFSSATPVSGKPYMGTCQRLVCLLCWWSWGWGEWAALFRFQDSLQMSQPAPTQTDCYLGNSGLGFPQHYLSTDSSAPILANTHRSCKGSEAVPRLAENYLIKRLSLWPVLWPVRPNLLLENKMTNLARPLCQGEFVMYAE